MKMSREIRSTFVAIVAVVALCFVKYSKASQYEQAYCTDLKPQNILDINQLMGNWYAVEIIPHLDTQEGTIHFDSCPVIHISEGIVDSYGGYQTPGYDYNTNYQQTPGYSNYQQSGYANGYNNNNNYQQNGYANNYQQTGYANGYNNYQQSGYNSQHQQPGYDSSYIQNYQTNYYPMRTTADYPRPGDTGYVWDDPLGIHNYKEYRGLKLLWDESDANNKIEYNLRFNNTRRGFWISSGPITESKSSHYSQFAGTIQVIKAVHDHLVLTICQRLPEAQLFSVILARDPLRLQRQVIHGIHQLLNKRDLTTEAIRKVCRNGSQNLKMSISQITISILIAAVAPYFLILKI